MGFRKKQAGVTLIEALASLAVGSMVIFGMGSLAIDYMNNTEAITAAQQLKTVAEAGRAYVTDNAALVGSRATTVSPCMITAADLGIYAPGIVGVNSLGQNMVALVIKNATGALQVMAVSYGAPVTPSDGKVAMVANALGGDGGGVYSTAPTQITGSGSAWTLNLTAPPGSVFRTPGVSCATGAPMAAVNIAIGSNAVAYWINDPGVASQTLYRNTVPGRPDLNTMNTPIIMSSMTIKVANAACLPTEVGALARDASGKVLTCTSSLRWEPQGSMYWADPVATFGALPACNAAADGVTRVVRTPTVGTEPRAYTCRAASASWIPLGTSDDGILRVNSDVDVAALGMRLSDIKNRLPKYQHMASYVVGNGAWVPWPACSTGGSPRVLAQSAVQQNAGAGATDQVWAVMNGGGWNVYVQSMVWASNIAGMAIANTYCYYP